jgi:hypothetical protein
MKCSEELGFNHYYVQSPCNPLIEHCTEIFYMIVKRDILPIQCTMSLRGPKSMRKVDGLSLIFIDFYVPALTPRPAGFCGFNSFAVCRIYTGVVSKVT